MSGKIRRWEKTVWLVCVTVGKAWSGRIVRKGGRHRTVGMKSAGFIDSLQRNLTRSASHPPCSRHQSSPRPNGQRLGLIQESPAELCRHSVSNDGARWIWMSHVLLPLQGCSSFRQTLAAGERCGDYVPVGRLWMRHRMEACYLISLITMCGDARASHLRRVFHCYCRCHVLTPQVIIW